MFSLQCTPCRYGIVPCTLHLLHCSLSHHHVGFNQICGSAGNLKFWSYFTLDYKQRGSQWMWGWFKGGYDEKGAQWTTYKRPLSVKLYWDMRFVIKIGGIIIPHKLNFIYQMKLSYLLWSVRGTLKWKFIHIIFTTFSLVNSFFYLIRSQFIRMFTGRVYFPWIILPFTVVLLLLFTDQIDYLNCKHVVAFLSTITHTHTHDIHIHWYDALALNAIRAVIGFASPTTLTTATTIDDVIWTALSL